MLGIGKLNIEYTPNTKEQWYFRTQVKKSNNDILNDISSRITDVQTNLLTTKMAKIYTLNQNVEWHISKSKKHTFSLALDFTLNQNDPTMIWNTDQPLFVNRLSLVDSDNIVIEQIKETKHQKLNAIFKHYWVLNGNNHIYTTLGASSTKEMFYTSDRQLLEANKVHDFNTAGFGNDLDFHLKDLSIAVHYKFRTGIATFKQGATLRNYRWKINQGSSIENNKSLVLPDFLASFEFTKSKKLKINYQKKSNFSNASRLTKNYYLRSYNSIFLGNDTLENELYHHATAYYSRFSMYRGIMFNSYLGYIKKEKGIRNAVQFDQSDQYLQPILLVNPEERWFLNTNLRKKIKNINYALGIDFSSANYVQPIDNDNSKNQSTSTAIELSAKTLYDSFPVIEFGVKRTVGDYASGTQSTKFTVTEPFLNIDYDFLKHYVFSFDYTNYDYENKNSGLNEQYQLANMSLFYKKEDRPWSFNIQIQNVFDMKYKKRHSFSAYIVSETSIFVLPRMFVLSISYQL